MKLKITLKKGVMALSMAAMAIGAAQANTRGADDTIVINSVPGSLENLLLSNSDVNGSFSNVYNLKITGEINGRDMNVFSDLYNLVTLDLSNVTVVSTDREDQYIRGCRGLYNLETVILPSNITTIEEYAFAECHSLRNINLGHVTKTGYYSLGSCESLTSVDLSSLKIISQSLFEVCRNLSDVKLSPELESIEWYAFGYTGLTTFEIPLNVRLSGSVFYGTPMKEIKLHSNKSHNSDSFHGMNELTDFYCYDPFPGTTSLNLENKPTLHVPAFAIDSYTNNSNYDNFGNVVALTEDLDYLEVYQDLEIKTTKGIGNYFDMDLQNYYSFINESTEELKINNFTQYARYDYTYNNGFELYADASSSFISNGPTTANNIEVNLELRNAGYSSDAWNFISFPYNVDVSSIIPPDNTLWVIREYDGALRGTNPESSVSKWINKTSGQLEAGKGYIINFTNTHDGWYNTYLPFTFPAANDAAKNNIFANTDVTRTLNFHDSEFEHNKSWNLIGNPFDCFFDIDYIKYGTESSTGAVTRVPVTVFRNVNGGLTYEAFSADDHYILRPFEAFFVQAVDEKNLDMVFGKDGRLGTMNGQRILMAPEKDRLAGTSRSIFNLYIDGENGKDRTRLVVNEDASRDYEIICDASKFFSPSENVPQIYSIENGENFAINERPNLDGIYNLGVRIGEKGVYTISLDTRNADGFSVILRDKLTNEETDLINEDYTFTCDPETINDRFEIRINAAETGIINVNSKKGSFRINGNILSVESEGQIEVYSIDGKVVANGSESLNVTLPQGIYIVKTANKSQKAIIR